MHVIWFKRDLRIQDNKALSQALQGGNSVFPLYIIEPTLWKQPDMSYRQYKFLQESLNDLNADLERLGQGLIVRVGEAVEVLQQIHNKYGIKALFSHQETWNDHTYKRDNAVKKWLKQHQIPWHEPPQNGVVRCLKSRDGWADAWYEEMRQPCKQAPETLHPINAISQTIPQPENLGLQEDGCKMRQKGGRAQGLKILQSFLQYRGEGYTKEMSSPVTAFESCSRISAHLAFGTLSMKEVFHAYESRNTELKQALQKGRWPSALRSFSGRLRWHCHFIQKLEDEPRIEFENMHTAYDGMRENHFNDDYFQAWKNARTGYPMVDACMLALQNTGWLNFRMRAMLMSFASYHLWLHWRRPALYLARMFTDYEPGIHYSQVQMQAGTTGINSVRIYNPIKQGVDHDPDGVFILQWIPELANIPKKFIHTPWLAEDDMKGYPMPIVDEKLARKAAADRIYALRKNAQYKEASKAIVHKHGSRKSGLPNTNTSIKAKKKRKSPSLKYQQIELPL